MVTYATPAPDVDLPVVTLPWDTFLAYMGDTWEPGQHIANIGPTG